MKKALKIIVIVLFVALAIFSVVAYILWKEQTTYIFECIIDFINRPLPIIGVSIAIIGLFVFKCFVATRYGKKAINEYKEENRVLKGQIEQIKNDTAYTLQAQNLSIKEVLDNNEEIKQVLIKSLELSKNIKVKELAKTLKGEQPYGEEEVDSQEETETL